MNRYLKTAIAASALALTAQAGAQVTLYEGEGYRGRAFSTSTSVRDLGRAGLNDRASSVVVENGRWEVCEQARFGGRCVVLRRGNYPSLVALGMSDNISSVRPAESRRRYTNEPQPVAEADYQYRRRYNEPVFDARVTNVRAVMGAASERCWVERQQVSDNSGRNIGSTIAGALIGGVLGHQVGGGSGRDIATVGGAVAGGAIGANMGRDDRGPIGRDVKRCETTPSTTPAYWDVTYNFKGTDHQLQMSAPPGATIAVNGRGEPRQ